jgi:hypothetical protein
MDYGATGGIHRSGRSVGVVPRRMLRRGYYSAVRSPGYPKPSVLSVRIFGRVACVDFYRRGRLPRVLTQARSVDKLMSSQPTYENELPAEEPSQVVRRSTRKDDDLADDELPQYDDGTLSDIVRKPTRAAADLDQNADLEDDLDAVLTDERAPTDREMIKEILERVGRIEEKLEQGDTQMPLA